MAHVKFEKLNGLKWIEKFRFWLGSDTDNSALILWRICWGFLIFLEGVGAVLTGWVEKTLIEPKFTFNFIGFEFLQPLPGEWMVVYYIIMGAVGLAIMLGFQYRLSSLIFFLMWTSVYLMQKTHYNNHYYLMMILGFLMILVPANRFKSLDVRLGYVNEKLTCPRWTIWIFLLLVGLVYVTASLNKIHADWLEARPLKVWFLYKSDYFLIGPLLAKEWFAYIISYGGVVYDGLIFFILLHPKTRNIGFVLSLVFNLFNSVVFQIGIFPYMMIAFSFMFYPGERLRKWFFRKSGNPSKLQIRPMPQFQYYLFLIFFLVNILLPLRHHLYAGDVHWTEEGHRLSWQMMLRAKSGIPTFTVVNNQTGERIRIKLKEHLSTDQINSFGVKPDTIWQFAQYLKKFYAEKGISVSVYCRSKVASQWIQEP